MNIFLDLIRINLRSNTRSRLRASQKVLKKHRRHFIWILVSVFFLASVVPAYTDYFPVQSSPPPIAKLVGISDFCVDGAIAINPDEIKINPPPPMVSGGGWYAGVVDPASGYGYGWSLSTSLQVPSTDPPFNDGYYLLLSCFDNAGSYNQIGLSAWDGEWWLLWSWTTHDIWGNLFYHYDAQALSLINGYWYEFAMVAEGNGYIRFELWTHGWRDWYSRKPTGGTVFILSYMVLVGIHLYIDFTLYEEVYFTQQLTPPYDFLFTQTWVDSTIWSYWATFKTGTGYQVSVTWNAYDVFIDNPHG